jgi:uncharacterized damage-inducible protein DinB
MYQITSDIQLLISRELGSLKKEIELFPNEEFLWSTMSGITNSAGNITLHICGNLQHFIGAVLGNSGYVRDRELEFSQNIGSPAELIREIEQTEQMIKNVLPSLSEETIATKYPQTVGGIELPCGRFLIHLSAHLSFHLGQIGYLRRILTTDNQSSGAVLLSALAAE